LAKNTSLTLEKQNYGTLRLKQGYKVSKVLNNLLKTQYILKNLPRFSTQAKRAKTRKKGKSPLSAPFAGISRFTVFRL
jgi:hypothetical protein